MIGIQHGAETGGDGGGGREEARENGGWSRPEVGRARSLAGLRMSKEGGPGGSWAYAQCGRRVVVGSGSLMKGEGRNKGCGEKRVPELPIEPLLDRGQVSELESRIQIMGICCVSAVYCAGTCV